MLPIIALVGRPNVGKSTLFNKLTKTRAALVADIPGVTRDRQYGRGVLDDRAFWVIDTGGVDALSSQANIRTKITKKQTPAQLATTDLKDAMQAQTLQAVIDADFVLFMVDGKSGLTIADQQLAAQLRQYREKIILVVNKVDKEEAVLAQNEFYQLGLGEPQVISATQGRGIYSLTDRILKQCPESTDEIISTESHPHIAVIGRPNVGKSTLINRILGEERMIVFDAPGTTRDSISVTFERLGQTYTLIDTAGVRKRARILEPLEKFSVVKTMQTISAAEVVLLVCDAKEGITDQDLHLLGLVIEAGRAIIIVVNKWDGLDEHERERVQQELRRRLEFVDYARRYFISALHGSGVGNLYRAIMEAYQSATQSLSTAMLTQALLKATTAHQPPLSKGRRIRLRLAHLGSQLPLVIVVHGKQTAHLPLSYHRYLANFFRNYFNLVGIPILLRFKSDANPFVDHRNRDRGSKKDHE